MFLFEYRDHPKFAHSLKKLEKAEAHFSYLRFESEKLQSTWIYTAEINHFDFNFPAIPSHFRKAVCVEFII